MNFYLFRFVTKGLLNYLTKYVKFGYINLNCFFVKSVRMGKKRRNQEVDVKSLKRQKKQSVNNAVLRERLKDVGIFKETVANFTSSYGVI